jgi:hypothetical protein
VKEQISVVLRHSLWYLVRTATEAKRVMILIQGKSVHLASILLTVV